MEEAHLYFFYNEKMADTLIISRQDILTSVNPSTATGRSYSLTEEEINNATKILDARKLNN